MNRDPDDVRAEFREAVNMTPRELSRWLETPESRSVGVTPRGTRRTRPGQVESVGHASGRAIVAILEKKAADLREDDYAHMRKVVGYVRRHLAQRPGGEHIEDSRWRYSLMNWGHDPLKDRPSRRRAGRA
ncbi:DUF3140 domain-containing protein [Thermomonospora umbrina]|uniref:Uncharacterized protein DUF3140 n=1 Tax=Thermomonospora umbrina TaxID=111806 RepID=A0A3D9SQV4_9ACTN|nr:DUF3140 domain-containing protein [Thermomonospora umbrina]REE94974.1 uncharacterized protein DUF3140 [Thermomonospora umbrina]